MRAEAPVRVRRTYRQHLDAPPQQVFPLLCPVREHDWIAEWETTAVYSESGVAEPECVFTTPADRNDAVWVITRYEPDAYRVEFVKITPGLTAGRIFIALHPDGPDRCTADVTYMHTALSDLGRAFVEQFTEAAYETFMKTWEANLNHYLHTGTMRPPEAP